MKEDNIEICTIDCASMHSLLCMRRKAVKFKKRIVNVDLIFELKKCKTLLFNLAIYVFHTPCFFLTNPFEK